MNHNSVFLKSIYLRIVLITISTTFFLNQTFAQQSVLEFSTLMGGGDTDLSQIIKVVNGETYIFSSTSSSDFQPVTDGSTHQGNNDIVITKFDADCNLAYSTLYGGDGDDNPIDVKIVGDNIFLVNTVSGGTTFPVTDGSTNGGTDHTVFSRIDANTGTIEFSTYIGGSNYEQPEKIVCEGDDLYLAISTNSTDFPVTDGSTLYSAGAGGFDIALVKMDSSANISYATYAGAYASFPVLNTINLAVENGEAYLTLLNELENYPLTDGNTKGDFLGGLIVHKFDATGQTVYANCLMEGVGLIGSTVTATLDNGKIFINNFQHDNANQGVITDGSLFNNGVNNYMVSVVDAASGQINYAGYYEGNVKLAVENCEVWIVSSNGTNNTEFTKLDANQNVAISGNYPGGNLLFAEVNSDRLYTVSTTTTAGFQTTDGSRRSRRRSDVSLAKISPNGQLEYLSYFGGSSHIK